MSGAPAESAVHDDSRDHAGALETKGMFDNASFEEYIYWAKISRTDERYEAPTQDYELFGRILKKSSRPSPAAQVANTQVKSHNHKEKIYSFTPQDERSDRVERPSDHLQPVPYTITDEEYVTASRALRTATWTGVFYLITTDILGPFGNPWAMAAMGYGPGIVLYTIFGALAFYCGMLLWKCFLNLDSDRFPLSSYGDIAYRIFGEWARQIVNILQSIQLIVNVAIICVTNGQSLEQIIVGSGRDPLCYVICILIWALVGMVAGQIRTLQKLSWIANISIWLNIFIIIVTMVLVAKDGVNVDAAVSLNTAFDVQPNDVPITTPGVRSGQDFTVTLTGLMVAVYAYGGATVFVEFMAEMRRPFDFWKGMLTAQVFIYFFYMLYGLFVYSFQGQFSINPAFQGIVEYSWQTACNVIYIVTGTIAAMIYGNVSIKVIYNHLLMRHLSFPHLSTRGGKIAWVGVVPAYWALAFIIGAAVPQISALQGFIGAVAILQFSYTFPLILIVGLLVRRDAMLEGDGFNPVTGNITRQDSGIKRWIRGHSKHWVFNTWNIVLALGSLATAVLGAYSAIIQIQKAFAAGSSPSFTCQSPF